MSFPGQRILKSITGPGDAQIEDYRTSIFRLRDLFLNHATVTTEITALQILDDVGGLSTKLDGISTQITDAGAHSQSYKILISPPLYRSGCDNP